MSMNTPSAAHFQRRRARMLAGAGRLKQKLPRSARAPRPGELTEAQWLAKHTRPTNDDEYRGASTIPAAASATAESRSIHLSLQSPWVESRRGGRGGPGGR